MAVDSLYPQKFKKIFHIPEVKNIKLKSGRF